MPPRAFSCTRHRGASAVADDKLLTVPEVAERTRVGVGTVRRWLRTRKLKGHMLGGTKTGYRVEESDLAAFIDGAATADR